MAGGSLPDVCADCDGAHPKWAAVNYGVLLCDDCSTIHRHLGRHVSQVKHLIHSKWRPTQLTMVRQLAAMGANRFWEHMLLAPPKSSKKSSAGSNSNSLISRKPLPTDSAHNVKTEFIREKYLFLAFFMRPPVLSLDDLNQQLHASVRTPVLESSLYLLALGADPNFVHPVKGTSPLHVACMNNQVSQVELLLTYGADLNIKDINGHTSLEIALLQSKHGLPSVHSIPNDNMQAFPIGVTSVVKDPAWVPLISCLIQARYEVTDLMSYFLCRQVPEHRIASSQHFLIPKLNTELIDSSSAAHEARRRLQMLPNSAFKDLCVDVHDEIERRETNKVTSRPSQSHEDANKSINLPPERDQIGPHCLPFLPPNRAYSSTRNQGRQKLARLGNVELNTLTFDLLAEAKERMSAVSTDEHRLTSSGERLSSLIASSLADRQSGLIHQRPIPIPVPRIAKPPTTSAGNSRTSSHRNSLPGSLCAKEEEVYDFVAGDSEYASVFELGLRFPAADDENEEISKNNGHGINGGQPNCGQPARFYHEKRPSSLPSETEAIAKSDTIINFEASRSEFADSADGCSTGQDKSTAADRKSQSDERNQDRETIAMLRDRIIALDERNRELERKNLELEEKTSWLEKQMETVKEEKDALLAALAAGMVPTHPPTQTSLENSSRSSPQRSETPPKKPQHSNSPMERQITNIQESKPTSSGKEETSPSPVVMRHSSSKSTPAVSQAQHSSSVCTSTPDTSRIKSTTTITPSNSNYYSSGFNANNKTQGGIDLRQELLIRSQQMQASHPMHHHYLNVANDKDLIDTSAQQSARSYVNVPTKKSSTAQQHVILKPNPSSTLLNQQVQEKNISGINSGSDNLYHHERTALDLAASSSRSLPSTNLDEPGRPDEDAVGDDYTRPSGSGTPIDPLIGATQPLHEYDHPIHWDAGAAARGHTPVPAVGSEDEWPTSQKVVKAVEAVVRLIKTLLETANSSNASKQLSSSSPDPVITCATQIQQAVQNLVQLFPVHQLRSRPEILTPLHNIVSGADQLKRNCNARVQLQQQQKRVGVDTSSSLVNIDSGKSSAPVIQHAQEIALAARQLLQRCQKG